jgi:hypothetical protein
MIVPQGESYGALPRAPPETFLKKGFWTSKNFWKNIWIEFLTLCLDLTCGDHLRGALPTQFGAKLHLR